MTTNHDNDLTIAGMLGLKILGEAPCYLGYCSSDPWDVSYDGQGESQPVYLDHCFCDCPLEGEIVVLGHRASCLKVVPFYHLDTDLAVKTLEQICDGRGLVPICRYGLDFVDSIVESKGNWFVELVTKKGRVAGSAIEQDLRLAICKALVGMREKDE